MGDHDCFYLDHLGRLGLKVDPNSVSISGFSSGAYFAVQYQFAFSSSLVGAAVFAGGPYFCTMDTKHLQSNRKQ